MLHGPKKQSFQTSWARARTMSTNNKKPWRFAPLNPAYGNPDKKPQLRGIVFDVDGTLCEPQNYMFRDMRYCSFPPPFHSCSSIPCPVPKLMLLRKERPSGYPKPPTSSSTSTVCRRPRSLRRKMRFVPLRGEQWRCRHPSQDCRT